MFFHITPITHKTSKLLCKNQKRDADFSCWSGNLTSQPIHLFKWKLNSTHQIAYQSSVIGVGQMHGNGKWTKYKHTRRHKKSNKNCVYLKNGSEFTRISYTFITNIANNSWHMKQIDFLWRRQVYECTRTILFKLEKCWLHKSIFPLLAEKLLTISCA